MEAQHSRAPTRAPAALERQNTVAQLASIQDRAERLLTRQKTSAKILSTSTTNNLLSFGAGGTTSAEKAEKLQVDFKNEVLSVRARLRSSGRATINPRSRFTKIWDIFLVSALIWTTFVTPFEVAFSQGEAMPRYYLNRVVDVVFVVDVCLAFFMPYRASADLGGAWVYDRRKSELARPRPLRRISARSTTAPPPLAPRHLMRAALVPSIACAQSATTTCAPSSSPMSSHAYRLTSSSTPRAAATTRTLASCGC